MGTVPDNTSDGSAEQGSWQVEERDETQVGGESFWTEDSDDSAWHTNLEAGRELAMSWLSGMMNDIRIKWTYDS